MKTIIALLVTMSPAFAGGLADPVIPPLVIQNGEWVFADRNPDKPRETPPEPPLPGTIDKRALLSAWGVKSWKGLPPDPQAIARGIYVDALRAGTDPRNADYSAAMPGAGDDRQ